MVSAWNNSAMNSNEGMVLIRIYFLRPCHTLMHLNTPYASHHPDEPRDPILGKDQVGSTARAGAREVADLVPLAILLRPHLESNCSAAPVDRELQFVPSLDHRQGMAVLSLHSILVPLLAKLEAINDFLSNCSPFLLQVWKGWRRRSGFSSFIFSILLSLFLLPLLPATLCLWSSFLFHAPSSLEWPHLRQPQFPWPWQPWPFPSPWPLLWPLPWL